MDQLQLLDKLNRLRVNARKNPLKVWKGSTEQLEQQIARFEAEGWDDSLPGAQPIPPDYNPPPEEKKASTGKEADVSGLTQPFIPPKRQATAISPDATINKQPARLARGTETESHCKKAVADQRQRTKAERKTDKKRHKEVDRLMAGKKPKAKKAKIKKNKDGTSTKTTTNGNTRQLGKDLSEKIDKMRKEKHADKRTDSENFTVAELARELDIDPKVARAKLRRHEDKIKNLHSKGQDRWVFPNKARKELKKILTGK